MRFQVVGVIIFGIYIAVYCVPNAAKTNRLEEELVREIADLVLEDPAYKEINEDNLETARNANPMPTEDELVREIADEVFADQFDGIYPPYREIDEDNIHKTRQAAPAENENLQNSNEPPYIDETDNYLQLVREVADQYLKEERTEDEGLEPVGSRTASDALRAFNGQSRRTRQIAEQNEREATELETLLLLSSNEKPNKLQQRNLIDLTARRAKKDPTCKLKVDCYNKKNLNFVDGFEFRTINGTCNNQYNFSWGMAGAQHRRLLPNAYEDGKYEIRKYSVLGGLLPSARNVSNYVHKTKTPKPKNDDGITIAYFYFLQLIDHDLAKTPEGHVRKNKKCCKNPNKAKKYCLPIVVDVADDHFKQNYCFESRRSFTLFRCNDKTKVQNQINDLTSYLDASMVYGSSEKEEKLLRDSTGGCMKESAKDFLPNSTHAATLPCNITQGEFCFEAGDTRANVHPGLTMYHTALVRQHNLIAKKLGKTHYDWTDERIYQETRKIIGAQIQHIVYTEMLPLLISAADLKKYKITKKYSYKHSYDATLIQAFSLAYRYHQLMPDKMNLADIKYPYDKVEIIDKINQEKALLRPPFLVSNNYDGINEVALGMTLASCPRVNRLMNSATRDLLFLDKYGNSFDLVVLNIMRGREWGTPPYTKYRDLCGLGYATTWDDLKSTTDDEDIEKMKQVYRDVRDVDLWTGVVTERKLPGTISGATQSCLLAKHFSNLKHGDRFWYESDNVFRQSQLKQIKKKTTLARILCDNLDKPYLLMRPEVFRTTSDWKPCVQIKSATGGDWNFKNW